MKQYSNPGRKPMMYGGMAAPKKRKKMESGGTAETQSRVATGKATAKDKAAMQTQRIEELGRMSVDTLRKIAAGPMSDKDTMLARKVLRDKGDKGAMPSGDKEPAGKMYGGMARKKMASGGKLKMVEKDGKKVPFYAADGKGKMMYGGKAKKK